MDAATPITPRPFPAFVFLSAIAPLLLLAGLIWWFFHGGSELIQRPVPPIKQISIRRVELKPGEFKLTIRNTGPMPVDMTLVTVDEAIWKAGFSPSRHLERLRKRSFAFRSIGLPATRIRSNSSRLMGCHSRRRFRSPLKLPGRQRECSLFSARWDFMSEFSRSLRDLVVAVLAATRKELDQLLSQLHGRPPGFSRRRRVARGFGGCRATPWRILRGWTAGTRFHARLPSHHSPRPVFPRPERCAWIRILIDSGLHDRLRHRHSQFGRGSGYRERLRLG